MLGILFEYPEGTPHGAITEVFAAVRGAGRDAWVAVKPTAEPRFPALVAFDASQSSAGGAARAYAHGCKLGHRRACSRSTGR